MAIRKQRSRKKRTHNTRARGLEKTHLRLRMYESKSERQEPENNACTEPSLLRDVKQ